MVRGLIREVEHPGTGKTQTRRILRLGTMLDPMPDEWEAKEIDGVWWFVSEHPDCSGRQKAPVRFAKGDRLWVRETWRCNGWASDVTTIFYRASEGDGYTAMCEQWPVADHKPLRVETKWSPSLHLPRWASRLTLTVTDVRVQRLQECTREDAIAEGIQVGAPLPEVPDSNGDIYHDGVTDPIEGWTRNPVAAYASLWDHINGAGAWDANPWIVAVTFAVERRNIDAARAA